MRYSVSVNGRQHTVELEEDGHLRRLTLDQRTFVVDCRHVGFDQASPPSSVTPADLYSLLVGDQSYTAYARELEDGGGEELAGRRIEVSVRGHPYTVEVQDARALALASLAEGTHPGGEAGIRAPMPGLVANVLVAVGDEVQRGQTIVVLEAMKMENDLTTPRAGRVRSLRVVKGQAVSQGEVLATIGDPDSDTEPGASDGMLHA